MASCSPWCRLLPLVALLVVALGGANPALACRAGPHLASVERALGGPFVPARRAASRLRRVVAGLPLGSPLAVTRVTSGFGRRVDPINHRHAAHEGIDLAAAARTPVHATAAGRVVFAGRRGGYGRMVEVDHGYGVHTRYAHLARILVRPGQRVALRQGIGLVGSSGRTTGPHLHYEIRVDGIARNPARFLAACG